MLLFCNNIAVGAMFLERKSFDQFVSWAIRLAEAGISL